MHNMQQKKWLSFILCFALIVTSFIGIPVTAYAADPGGMMHDFTRGVTFTKADAAGVPASPAFAPGSKGTVNVPVTAPTATIPGFYVLQNDYDYSSDLAGGYDADREVKFAAPYISKTGNWILQASINGTDWITCNGGTTYPIGTDWIYTTPTDGAIYRLKVASEETYTNSVQVESPGAATEFIGWGSKGYVEGQTAMGPFVGCGCEIDSVRVGTPDAISLTQGDIIYEWYRVDPVDFSMTLVTSSATQTRYITTADDIGYQILCKVKGDGYHVGGYLQIMPLGQTIAAPVKGYVSHVSGSSFVLNLESNVELTADDLRVETYQTTPCAIDSIQAISGSSVYLIQMSNDPNGYNSYDGTQKFIISSEKRGIIIGQEFIPPSFGYENDPSGLTAQADLASPTVTVTSELTGDQVYHAGDTFSCDVDLAGTGISNGTYVRVALGRIGSTPGSIYPFLSGNPLEQGEFSQANPFSTASALEVTTSALHNYYYSLQQVNNGKVSISGVLNTDLCPATVGIIIVSGDGTAVLSNRAILSSGNKPVMFGVENALPFENALPGIITAEPALNTISNFYNVPEITFKNNIGVFGVETSMTFHNINLMEDYNELMQLNSGMIMGPIDPMDGSKGFELGLDDFKLDSLASHGATLQVSGLTSWENLNNFQPFTVDDFVITGEAISGAAVYSNGTLTFDVAHFSNYQVMFATGSGPAPETTNAALTIDVNSVDTDNVYFAGETISYVISGLPDSLNGNPIKIVTSAITGGGVLMDQKLLANSTDGANYWYNTAIVSHGSVTVSGNVVAGWPPSKVFIQAFDAGGQPVMAPIQLMDGQFKVADGMPVNPDSLIGINPVKIGLENGMGQGISCQPSLNEINDLYHVPVITLIRDFGNGAQGKVTFHNVDFATNEDELLSYLDGIKMTATDSTAQNVMKELIVGVDTESEYKISALENKPAMITVDGFGGQVFPAGLTLSSIQILPEQGKAGMIITPPALVNNELTFGVNHFSDYKINILSPSAVNDKASLQDLSARYLDDRGDMVDLWLDDFNPATTSYAITIFDPSIPANKHITVEAIATTGCSILQNNGVDLVNGSGTALVVVQAESGATNTYQIYFTVDRRSIYAQQFSGATFITGNADSNGLLITLAGTDNSGDDCSPFSLGAVNDFSIDRISGGAFGQAVPLVSGTDYMIDVESNQIKILPSYLNKLNEGKHPLRLSLDTKDQDGTVLRTGFDIFVAPATTTIHYGQPADGSLTVYPFTWNPDSETGTMGNPVQTGGTVPVGNLNDIVISTAAIDNNHRLASLVITEDVFGNVRDYDVTAQFLNSENGFYCAPFGIATISAIYESFTKPLPQITGIELYGDYDKETGEFTGLIPPTTSGIKVTGTVFAKILFNPTTPPENTYVYYTWENNETWFHSDPVFCLNLKDVEYEVADSVVTLTAEGIDKYSTGKQSVSFFVKGDPTKTHWDAPANLQGIAPSTPQGTGSISNTTATMEYRLASGTNDDYMKCGAGQTTGLTPGAYLVRYYADATHYLGTPAAVTIPTYDSQQPTLLTIGGITAVSKAYDGTTTAAISGTPELFGVKQGDTVGITGTAIASFADKNAGTGKTVTITGYSLTGADAANYTLSLPVNLAANITKLNLTASAINQQKNMGDVNPTPVITYAGFIVGETAANSGITAPTANHTASLNSPAGTYDITLSGGSGGQNYNLTTVKGTLTVIRTDIPLTGINILKDTTTMLVGGTETLAVDFTPTSASVKTLTWSTSNSAIATVDTTGKVTGVSAGAVTITATAADGGYSDSCLVTVQTPIGFSGVLKYNDGNLITPENNVYQVEGAKFPIVEKGYSDTVKPLKLELSGSGTQLNDQTQYSVVMTFNQLSKAVTKTGLELKNGFTVEIPRLSSMVDGTHTLTFALKEGDQTKATIQLNLKISGTTIPVEDIEVPFTQPLDLNHGSTYALSATVYPVNASNKSYSWSTSDAAVATISNGVLTAQGAGTTTITATTDYRGYQDSFSVNVGADVNGIVQQKGQSLPYAYVYLYQGQNYMGSAVTDVSGKYGFTNLKVGNYTIKAFGNGTEYADISTDVAISVGSKTVTAGALNFTSAYSDQATLNIILKQDPSGNAYTDDAYISVYCYETGYSLYRALTDAEKAAGKATLTGLDCKPGTGTNYNVSISTTDYWNYDTVLIINNNNAEIDKTFNIPLRYSITGYLKLAGTPATPISSEYVVAKKGDFEMYFGYTDSQGKFTISGLLPNENYTVEPYYSNKYIFNPIPVNDLKQPVTLGQDLVVSKGAQFRGHVIKTETGLDAYKAYVTLYRNDGNNYGTYIAGTYAGASGFNMDGVIKQAGDYRLQIAYVYEKNGIYPPFESTAKDFTVTSTTGIYSEDVEYHDPVIPSNVFKGSGNTVVTDLKLVREGSQVNLVIKYKNNESGTVNATIKADLPAGITCGGAGSISLPINNLTAGAIGQKSFILNVGKDAKTYSNIPVKVVFSGDATEYDFGSATLELAGVTLNAPGTVKVNEAFRVYGEATANSTVIIKDAETGNFFASAQPNGRWFSTSISIPTAKTTKLIAEITSGSSVIAVSPVASVEATEDPVKITNVKSASLGMSELPMNQIIGARAFTAWVDSQMNGRDIVISTLFDRNIISSVTYHYSDSNYTASKDADGYYTATLSGWSGCGLKTITATVVTTGGKTYHYIIAEVTVLVDPSGYVYDAETGNMLTGVTVTCQSSSDGGTTWTNWSGDKEGGLNPQKTDSEGHYGWMVPAGRYRVCADMNGYQSRIVDRNSDGDLIIVPPPQTKVDFSLTPKVLVEQITLNPGSLSVEKGKTAQLVAKAAPENATNASKITFSSSNNSIAEVNSATGVITGKATGTATITAIFARADSLGNDLTATCAVIVTEPTGSTPSTPGGPGGAIGGAVGPLPSTGPDTSKAGSVTTIKATVEGTLNGNVATATVSKETIASMLDSAKKAETGGQKSLMQFTYQAPAAAKEVKVAIPGSSFSQIVSDTNADVSVKTPLATLTFNEKAVNTLDVAGKGQDVGISVTKADTATLSQSVKDMVGDRPVYDFNVTVGSKEVSSFNGGTVSVSIPYTLKAGEDPNAIVVYYIDSNGKVKNINGKYNSSTGSVEFNTTHFSKYAVGYNKVAFSDVKPTAWYNNAVTFMAARGITTGTSEGVFSPSMKLTRAQFLVMALRAYGIEADENPSGNFSDAGNTYYTNYLASAKRLGISNGDGNGHFSPNAQITRQDMFVLLYRTLEVLGELPEAKSNATLTQFSDAASVSSYATSSLEALVKANVVSGSNGQLDPKGFSSRAQMAQVLYNLLSN